MRRALTTVLGALVGVVMVALCAAPPVGATTSRASQHASGDVARADRATLLVQIAELTDRLEGADAGVVAAQLHRTDAQDALADARGRVRARAVTAYVRGTGASVDAFAAPAAYTDVVARKQRELSVHLHAALQAASTDAAAAESARTEQRRLSIQLTRAQEQLDATIADDDALRAEEDRRADAARAAALAARAQADAQAKARRAAEVATHAVAAAGRGGAPGAGAATLAELDVVAPNHAAATAAQSALLRRHPFGVLAPGTGLPPGLHDTGGRVTGVASWYGPGFDGRPTATGAVYDMEGWTVASPDLPLGSLLVIATPVGRALVLVNDRGPYVPGRVLDLSHAVAAALGVSGLAPVTAMVVAPG